jgi:hypothetical protein
VSNGLESERDRESERENERKRKSACVRHIASRVQKTFQIYIHIQINIKKKKGWVEVGVSIDRNGNFCGNLESAQQAFLAHSDSQALSISVTSKAE